MIGPLQRKSKTLKKTKRENLDKLLNYLRNNKQYMMYDTYLARGYPIGSGVVEGTCRHLVRDRMEGNRDALGNRRSASDAKHSLRLR